MDLFSSEYLSSTNPIASIIVTFLRWLFFAWLVGLIGHWIWLWWKKREIEKEQNIQPLVTARQERDVGREDDDLKAEAEDVCQKFFKKPFLGKPSPITEHLKAIFLAGWEESRLEVSELINHTTSNLFRWNNLFRSVLAIFIVIGLLGTLFGLTDSLTDLAPALKEGSATPIENTDSLTEPAPVLKERTETATENSKRMTQALGELMDDIKGAFAPSIWGIIFTILGVILYGVYLQFACHPIKSTLERLTLTVWVPQLYPTTSQKLNQTLQQSESQMQKGFETAAQFSESVRKVQGNIGKFNESLTQARAITQPLSDSVTQINKAASDISTAANVLNTGFTENLDKFSKEFSSSVTHLTGFQDEIRNLHREFQEASNRKLDQQTQKLEAQNQNLATTLDVLKNYENLYVDSCEQINSTLQKFLNKTAETSGNIEAANREFLEEINAANREWIEEIQTQLKTDLAIIQPTLEDGLKTLTHQLNLDLKEVQRALDERLEALTNQLNFFQLPIERTANQIEGIIESFTRIMGGVVKDLQSEFQKQNETIKEQNESYEDQLTGVKDLNESVINLLNQLDKSSENQKNAVSALSTNVTGLTTDIKNLNTAINTFTSDSGDLSQSIGAIKGDVEKLGTASQQFVEKVENADVTPLTANIERLNIAIEGISQNTQTLANAVNRLARQGSSSVSEPRPKRSFFGRVRKSFSRKR